MLQVMYASSTVQVSCLQMWSGRVSHLHHRRHVMHDTSAEVNQHYSLDALLSIVQLFNSLDADTTTEERNRRYDCRHYDMQFLGPGAKHALLS